ncbi:phosphoribosylformylglycinamidine synthase [Candidatus Nomurabacteria bacterium]|nr:phosphoribosylformylglycinamidine synthase [Candidatus Nomurabacteria bacterium]
MISRVYVKQKNEASSVDSYLITHNFSREKMVKIAKALTNPTIEEFSINKFPKTNKFSYAIEIGFKPGVTDNVGHTVDETISDLFHISASKNNPDFAVYSSKIYLVSGVKNLNEIEKLALSLHNPLIERSYIASSADIKKNGLLLRASEVILGKHTPVIEVPLSKADTEELINIGKAGVMNEDGSRRGPLALDLVSMEAIQTYFRGLEREPTDIELESLAQTWSEHCKHTIFANPIDDIKDGLYKTYIKGAANLIRKKRGKKDFCVSVFSDNSGGIVFDNDYLITHKVETHNSPSALDPFGGAITGIVGVNRDTIGFGMGAKPVANVYGFCLGNPEDEIKYFKDPPSPEGFGRAGNNLRQPMLLPKRIMEGVIKGINVGGNCSGIPTLNGFIKFDDRYRAKPLVFAGTAGLIPRIVNGKPSHLKKAKAGDYIVMVGGRVGLDGIHGATFSSVVMDSNSPATAVQIGDPITQKKLSDAIVKEARDLGLYNSITDNGAGGLSCSVAEMARDMRLPAGRHGGAEVDLEKVPLKYPGLRPWEIWISESQERMTLSVPKSKWKAFQKLMERRGVEAAVIGKFTNSGKCVVKYKNKKIMDLDMEFLRLPKQQLYTKKPPLPPLSGGRNSPPLIRGGREGLNFTKSLEKLLSQKNISGFSFISQQYDHEVQASSVLKPLSGRGRINTDTQVFRPILKSDKGVVLTSSTYPSYGDISAYNMSACAIDTAVRNTISAGGTLSHLAILDNFCWCSSNDPKRLYQLTEAVKACCDTAVGFGTPFISGKDSMFNDFKGYDENGKPIEISVPPTILISAISVMPDFNKTISPEFKNAGDIIYLLGETHDELGGGEYLKNIHPAKGTPQEGNVPKVDVKKNIKTYLALEKAIQKELAASAISVNSGGLGIALAKASVGGMIGCDVSIKNIKGTAKSVVSKLFSESQGRILVSVSPKNARAFEKIMEKISYAKLGKVTNGDKFIITDKTKVIDTSVKKLHKIYHKFSNSMK